MNSELGDDDWQNIEIPDELIDFPETIKNKTIKNKEKELKELEDRKLVEASELPLINELFTTRTDEITKEPIMKEPITDEIMKEPIMKEPITNIDNKTRKTRKSKSKNKKGKK